MNYMSKTKRELVEIINGLTSADRSPDVKTLEMHVLEKKLDEVVDREVALIRENEALKLENKALSDHLDRLQVEFDSGSRAMHEADELIRCLSEAEDVNIFVVDQTCIVRYVGCFLGDMAFQGIRNDLSGKHLLELIEYRDIPKLTDRLNRALNGKKEKLKDVSLKSPFFPTVSTRAKLYPVTYKNRPAIKMVFKRDE